MRHKSNLLLSLFFCSLIVGCATQTRVVTTERTYEDPYSPAVRTETTERRTETTREGGVLSGTVDVVGKTLALPFRAAGGLIDAIF